MDTVILPLNYRERKLQLESAANTISDFLGFKRNSKMSNHRNERNTRSHQILFAWLGVTGLEPEPGMRRPLFRTICLLSRSLIWPHSADDLVLKIGLNSLS